MHEGQVKAALLTYIREQSDARRKPVVTAEFTLGSSGVRADLVAFSDVTIGFEIKTAMDTLRRLPSQMEAYARYFDHAVAVVAPCHLPNLIEDHMHGASVWTYDEHGQVWPLHAGRSNLVTTSALDDLLTQAERRRGDFRAAMVARYGETSRSFWVATARRSIRAADLPRLSRFSEMRVQARQLAAERDARWDQWLAAQSRLCLASA